MKNAKLNWVRLPIDNLENCRELGGYETKYGQQTKWHSFLRSSDLSGIEEKDIRFLKEYGVNTVIDLRRKNEIVKAKNPLSDTDFVDYHNIPFITDTISDITKYYGKDQELTVSEFYIQLLNQKDSVKQIFETIHFAKEGCILFHCRVGKDRTGVLALLLLGLAGVRKKDIIANYEVSYSKLESLHDFKQEDTSLPLSFLYSNREYMMTAYEFIKNNYGTFEDYLLSTNLNPEIIEGVKARVIHDYSPHKLELN
ncbi:tyrosine-protein phosphatase [Oceanobacillus halophilus]|nr:tyrosine-protein phosphatase [Oceanobacillus halophilus]